MGYSTTLSSIPNASTVRKSFSSNKVVHILSHGIAEGGYITCADSTYLTGKKISSYYSGSKTASSRFVFLCVCYSGLDSSKYGSLPDSLSDAGVKMILSFSGTVSASTTSNGIHYFAKRVYYYLDDYNLNYAVRNARIDTYSKYGYYYGTKGTVIKGGTKYLN